MGLDGVHLCISANAGRMQTLTIRSSSAMKVLIDITTNRKSLFMKIGYLFPVAIIVSAVVLLAWFVIGGYAMPGQ
ncbi:YoaK family small membrane protein [Cedecea sp. FDAARGOS_727]|uniref:YoaK family small membrane protein n=1 Tax=Cedecea sp. FDAARGOS_727 TaxID=2545798 RepID=UPI0035303C65